jgi:hypothetical protein
LTPLITSYKRKIAATDYEKKVPEDVRILNSEKLLSYEKEFEATLLAIENFKLIN